MVFLKSPPAKEVEEAGEKTSAFEMVSPPRKQPILKFICIAKNLNFDCSPFPTAKSDILSHRLQTVSAALNLERFASSARERNGIERVSSQSEQPRGSVRTSFGCRSICLWKVRATGRQRCRPLQCCTKLSQRLFKKLSGYAQTD